MMEENNNIERRLWDYIDGIGSPTERLAIDSLLQSNRDWKEKYAELLDVHHLMQSSVLEEPSMRFTKNVMEEIAKLQIAPATKSYINNKIIWGLGFFFIALMLGSLIYGFGQLDWTTTKDNDTLPVNISKIDYSRLFNNNYVNVFLMINVVLGLMLLDRYLASKKKKVQKQA